MRAPWPLTMAKVPASKGKRPVRRFGPSMRGGVVISSQVARKLVDTGGAVT
jgi:hypothetical protein